MFHGKDMVDLVEKVRQGKVISTGCSKVFHGKDVLDKEEEVRLTGCSMMFHGRHAGFSGKGETGKGDIHRMQYDVPWQRRAGYRGKSEMER